MFFSVKYVLCLQLCSNLYDASSTKSNRFLWETLCDDKMWNSSLFIWFHQNFHILCVESIQSYCHHPQPLTCWSLKKKKKTSSVHVFLWNISSSPTFMEISSFVRSYISGKICVLFALDYWISWCHYLKTDSASRD